MANHPVQKVAEELKSSSNILIERIGDSRRKTYEVMASLRELEDAIKTRIREDHERQRAEEAEAHEREQVVEPARPRSEPVAQPEPAEPAPQSQGESRVVAEAPRAGSATVEPAAANAQPAPAPEARAETPAAKAEETLRAETPAESRPAAAAPRAQAAPPQPRSAGERVFTPRSDDRPRPSFGGDRPQQDRPPRVGANGAFIPRNPDGTPRAPGSPPPPRVGANGAFIPRNPDGTPRAPGSPPPPRVGANGAFIPRPREGGGTFTPRPQGQGYGPRPGGAGGAGRPAGGGYGQRPVSERDIKKQLNVTPTQQKDRVSNYDPNKTDYRRREKAAETNAADKSKNRKTLLTEVVPGADLDDYSFGSRRKKSRKMQPKMMERIIISEAVVTGERVAIKTLAERIGKPASDIIKKLFLLGQIATINQDIDFDTAALISGDFGVTLTQELQKSFEEQMVGIYDDQDAEANLQTRPPIVTIMGHVDHGKTSLLDAIRSTRVAAGEAGGITQHIGAYSVSIHDRPITFLDTPGHEAFTSMRARGAQATDIAVLVVAANDGVMPQTIEAINHAKAANVPIIVAINKIDLPGADPDRVKQQLTEYGLVAEEWGGETVMAPVSATTKQGIEQLLEMILLVADVQELKANPGSRARGVVVEARMDRNRGPVATVLVQNGTLKQGDYVVVGSVYGRIRAMNDDLGKRVDAATPSMPVELMGLSETPEAGDIFYAVEDEKLARQVAEERRLRSRAEQMTSGGGPMKLDDLFSRMAAGELIDLNIIIRADVRGSAEAVKSSLEKLTNDKVRIRTLQSGVGSINENDIMLAKASGAIVIGFNVRPDGKAADAAEREGVDVRLYRIIYNAIEDMEKAMKGLLKPEFKEVHVGYAEIRNVIKLSSVGNIAGCYVTEGKMTRAAQVRLLRDGVVIYEGKLGSLKRFKDDVREVDRGYECGLSLDGYADVKEGDVIEAFTTEEVQVS